MDTIRKLAIVMLVVGILFVMGAYIRFEASHQDPTNRLPSMFALAAPGWSLLIMGWIGVVGYNVWRSLPNWKAAPKG